MTLQHAKTVLQHPVFGNPEHIEAVKVLELEGEAIALRSQLKGKTVECWCCDGEGEIECKAGCVHVCPTCDGHDELTLSPSILSDTPHRFGDWSAWVSGKKIAIPFEAIKEGARV